MKVLMLSNLCFYILLQCTFSLPVILFPPCNGMSTFVKRYLHLICYLLDIWFSIWIEALKKYCIAKALLIGIRGQF